MDRIHHVRGVAALSYSIRDFVRSLRDGRRIRTETARLDTLPRDRLADMGIDPRTEDNLRHSGQYGGLLRPQLW